jgi:hypothetical protein
VIAVTHQWLRHPEVADPFRCPADAVEAWQARGWQPCDEPAEVNPATAEAIAWRKQQAAMAAERMADEKAAEWAAEQATKKQAKTDKARAEKAADSDEGVNDVG